MKRISRKLEVRYLKAELKTLIKELGVSKRLFKKTLPRVKKSGYSYELATEHGHKQSLRQQYVFIKDLIRYNNEKKEKENAE